MSKALAVSRPAPIEIETKLSSDRSGAKSDEHLIDIWLRSFESPHTRRAYARDSEDFLNHLDSVGHTLHTVTVADLQKWTEQLKGETSSRARRIHSIKSLLSFGQETGYLRFNVGAAVKAPKVPNQLAERILTEQEVQALVRAAPDALSKAVILFLYGSGARVAEMCSLRWKHLHEMGDKTLVTLHGKGSKTRHVTIAKKFMDTLKPLSKSRKGEELVFRSSTGRPLHQTKVWKLLNRTARLAGLERLPSPHWLRHSYASHALARGANATLVQQNLGHSSLGTTGQYLHVQGDDGASLYLDTSWI